MFSIRVTVTDDGALGVGGARQSFYAPDKEAFRATVLRLVNEALEGVEAVPCAACKGTGQYTMTWPNRATQQMRCASCTGLGAVLRLDGDGAVR